jgi:hypothetical protein
VIRAATLVPVHGLELSRRGKWIGGAIAADLDKSDSFRGYLANYRGVVVRTRSACG